MMTTNRKTNSRKEDLIGIGNRRYFNRTFARKFRPGYRKGQRCKAALVLRLLLAGLFVPSALWAQQKFSVPKEQICNLQFPPPKGARVLQRSHDLALFRIPIVWQRKKYYVQLMLLCNPNAARTSRVGELEQYYRHRGDRVRRYKEFHLSEKILAASLERLRIVRGRKLLSREVYFATRNYEYHIRLFAENIPKLALSEELIYSKKCEALWQALLLHLHFQSQPEVTITEAQYRMRLYLSLFALCLLGLALLVWSLRKIFR